MIGRKGRERVSLHGRLLYYTVHKTPSSGDPSSPCITLHTKQNFQSNKTLRKLCGVLTTYQGLFFQKTSKKEFKFDLGGIKKLKVLFPPKKRFKLFLSPQIT